MAIKDLRLILTIKDISRVENCTRRTAAHKMEDIKIYYKKTEKRQKITFKEYSKYLRIPLEEFDTYR